MWTAEHRSQNTSKVRFNNDIIKHIIHDLFRGDPDRGAILCRYRWMGAVSCCTSIPVVSAYFLSALTDIQRISYGVISYLVKALNKHGLLREISEIKK